MKNLQDEIIKIHDQYKTSEIANYKIQLLFEEYHKNQLRSSLIDFFLFLREYGEAYIGMTIEEFVDCFLSLNKNNKKI